MKKIILGLLIAIGFFCNVAYAASDDECGIILCVPAGFASGCELPHRAMMKRIHALKSPVPPLSECLSDSEKLSSIDTIVSDGYATLFRETKKCLRYTYWGDHGSSCIEAITIPKHYIIGTNRGVNSVLFIDVKVEGERQGNPFFIGRNANNVEQLPYVTYSQYLSYYGDSANSSSLSESKKAKIKKYVELIESSRVPDLWINE